MFLSLAVFAILPLFVLEQVDERFEDLFHAGEVAMVERIPKLTSSRC